MTDGPASFLPRRTLLAVVPIAAALRAGSVRRWRAAEIRRFRAAEANQAVAVDPECFYAIGNHAVAE